MVPQPARTQRDESQNLGSPKNFKSLMEEFRQSIYSISGLGFIVNAPESNEPISQGLHGPWMNIQLANGHWILDNVLIEGCPPVKMDTTEYAGRIFRILEEEDTLKVWGVLEHPKVDANSQAGENGHHYSHRYFTGFLYSPR